MSNTADVTGGKPIALWSQSISGVNPINPLVAFYDMHGRKREVLFFYFVPNTTRDYWRDNIDKYCLIKRWSFFNTLQIRIFQLQYHYAGSFRMGVTDINVLNAHVNRSFPPSVCYLPHYTAYIDGNYNYPCPAVYCSGLMMIAIDVLFQFLFDHE
jgi:hypothetical protein